MLAVLVLFFGGMAIGVWGHGGPGTDGLRMLLFIDLLIFLLAFALLYEGLRKRLQK